MKSFYKLILGPVESCRSLSTLTPLKTFHHISKSAFRSTRNFSTASTVAMTVASESHTLVDRLSSLGLQQSLHTYPGCHSEVNTVDIYRAHLTSILTKLTGVDAAIVYPALAWTQTLEKGDLVLPVPALRVQNKKPTELAKEWADKVRFSYMAFQKRTKC
jgi:arginyl-tRNA synthetase